MRQLPEGFTFEGYVVDTLGNLTEKIDDLCTRTTVLETNFKSHVAIEMGKGEKKWKKLTAIFGIIGSASTLVALLNVLKSWT